MVSQSRASYVLSRHWLGSASFHRASSYEQKYYQHFPNKNDSDFLFSIYLLRQLLFMHLIHQAKTRTQAASPCQDHVKAPIIGSFNQWIPLEKSRGRRFFVVAGLGVSVRTSGAPGLFSPTTCLARPNGLFKVIVAHVLAKFESKPASRSC